MLRLAWEKNWPQAATTRGRPAGKDAPQERYSLLLFFFFSSSSSLFLPQSTTDDRFLFQSVVDDRNRPPDSERSAGTLWHTARYKIKKWVMSPRSFSPCGETFLLPGQGEEMSLQSHVDEASSPHFFSPRSLKLILPAKPRCGFFSPRDESDCRGKAASDLHVLPFLLPLLPPLPLILPLLPSPSTDTTRQRAATIKIDCYRLISSGNKAKTASVGGITR
ncbi:hypothetical protein B296_00044837 [Ensete ventricosum]|uniref:Uncharacterized protein n=1 Tax=Ensete ventricosum TaxID=4639 RepID=A0A426Z9H5_ENSVE|nr:hypothetical protein B296_00044837 [Ensete ventricosum]